MANNFVIRKGLIVSGSNLQPLNIQGTTGQVFNAASSSKGNTFSVNNISGLPLLKVSGSEVTLGLKNQFGNKPITFITTSLGSFVNITGSAFLTDLKTNNYFVYYYYVGEDLEEQEWYYGTGSLILGTPQQTYSILKTAEGLSPTASGVGAHAEGVSTLASGDYSHAEGGSTQALGWYSHAEGYKVITSGTYSHAEGVADEDRFLFNQTPGNYSHTQGYGTLSTANYQSIQGIYNTLTLTTSSFQIGNGYTYTDSDGPAYATSNLINTYGIGTNGVVEISGSLKVTGGITGSYSTQISPQTTSTYTLTNIDSGQEFLFRNNCDITLPAGLTPGFLVTITTLNTVAYILTGSGVTLINNKGTTIPMKSSATVVNTGTANEYLVLGDL